MNRSMIQAFLLTLFVLVPHSAAGRLQTLVGGSSTPGLVPLSVAQRQALGALISGDQPFCTAWLASARHGVTAAHCLAGVSDLSLVDLELQGEEGGRIVLPVVGVETHPTFDVAVVLLGAPPPSSCAVEPLTVNSEPLGSDDLGSRVEVAGAGLGTRRDDGVSFGVFTLIGLEPARVQIDGAPGRSLCRGDSGGPFLMRFAESPRVRVIAVESTGALDCDGPSWGTRTDVFAGWLAEVLARSVPGVSVDCTDEPPRCADSWAWSCRAGWWRGRDCAALGAACGERGASLGAGCLPLSCGAIDARGECEGSVARWCEDGRLQELRCAARGLRCGRDELAGGQRCIAGPEQTEQPGPADGGPGDLSAAEESGVSAADDIGVGPAPETSGCSLDSGGPRGAGDSAVIALVVRWAIRSLTR